jgi:hypothetical protein
MDDRQADLFADFGLVGADGSAAHPPPERQHSECDCEILVGASPAHPRLP